jgi:hypothetical protein
MATEFQKSMYSTVRVIACFCLCLSLLSCTENTDNKNPFPVTEARTRVLEQDEKTYSIEEVKYQPSVPIQPDKIEARYDAPEYAAITLVKAMLRGDYELWANSWDEKSKTMREERDRKAGRDQKFWIDIWKKNTAGVSATLIEKAEYEEYVLVSYQLKNSAGKVTYYAPIVLKKTSTSEWKATNKLMGNPVAHNWPKPLPNKKWQDK